MELTWIEPKTNWNSQTDRFNIEDYNRIKNNLEYLHEFAIQLYVPFDFQYMGEDAIYTDDWDVDVFNAFENNLKSINESTFVQDLGSYQTFYPNGVFIQADELNRIERSMVSIKDIFERQKAGLRTIPFRLGQYRSLRV